MTNNPNHSPTDPHRVRDVLVIGGDAAGLSAAVTLSPARRDVLVSDSGEPRNALAEGVGLRWGEMAGLRVGQFDRRRRRLDVAEAITEPKGAIIWGTPKNHERRSVPYPSFLDDHIDLLCAGKGPADTVFASPNGHLLRASNFRRNTFDTAVASLRETYPELPMITPHSLRHTAASLAISSAASVLSIQRMLGHSSAAMTLDRYSDLFDDDLDAVADALDQRARNTNVGKMWANPRSAPLEADARTPESQ